MVILLDSASKEEEEGEKKFKSFFSLLFCSTFNRNILLYSLSSSYTHTPSEQISKY